MVSPGAKLFLSVVLNISLEENWPTFVYLASDKLWRDPSELGGGGWEISIYFWPTLKTRYKKKNIKTLQDLMVPQLSSFVRI